MTNRSLRRIGVLCFVVVLGAAGAGYWRWQVAHRSAEAGLIAAGRLREAQLLLRDRMVKDPNAPEPHARMGELQLKLSDPIAAEKEFRRAMASGLPAETVLPGLAKALLMQGRYAEVLRLVPASGGTPAVAARNLLLRAETQIAQGEMAAADRSLVLSRSAAPDEADTALIAAKIAATRPKTAETEQLTDQVLQRDPGNLDALMLKVRLAAQRGDRAASRTAIEHALAMAPWSIEARLDRAYAEIADNNDQNARADVAILLRDQPNLVDAVYLNAVLLFRQGKYGEATTQLARLDAAGSRFPQVVFYQARIAQVQKQLETAAELARRYAVLVPADPDGVRLRAETGLALGRAAEVLPGIRQAVQTWPNDPAMKVLHGRLLAATGKVTEASRVLLDAADRSPPQGLDGELGMALLQTGTAWRALPLLRAAAGRQPGEATLWEGVALAAVEVQDTEAAAEALGRLRAIPDAAGAAGNVAGLIKLRAGDLNGAREEWTATLARVPAASAAQFNLARVQAIQGATAEAQEQLRRILAQDPADARALQLFIELSDGRPVTLIPRLQAAHDAQPRSPLFTALLGNALIADGKPGNAVDLIRKAATGAGTADLLLPVLARAQEASGQAEDAIATYRASLAVFPEDGLARTALLRLVREHGGDAEAIALLQSGVQADPRDAAQMYALASLVRRRDGVDAALALVDRLAADPATQGAAIGLRGAVLRDAGRLAEAAVVTTAEFEASPSLPSLLRMAAARGTAMDTEGAAGALRAWLAHQPDAVDAWAMLAKIDLEARRYPEALAGAAAVLRLRPRDAEALNNTAWIYFMTRDKRAKATAQDAFLQFPSADSADTLGWILLSDGNTQGALSLFRQAVRQRPNDPTIRYHLAAALAADGKKSDAVGLLTTLVGTGSSSFEDRASAGTLLDKLRASP